MSEKLNTIMQNLNDVELTMMNAEIKNCIEKYYKTMVEKFDENNINSTTQLEYMPIDLFFASAHGALFEILYKGNKEIGNAIVENYYKMVNDM
jgi:hypothetical protein